MYNSGKIFIVTNYDADGLEIKTWEFSTKKAQMNKYQELVEDGYRKCDLEKRTLPCRLGY